MGEATLRVGCQSCVVVTRGKEKQVASPVCGAEAGVFAVEKYCICEWAMALLSRQGEASSQPGAEIRKSEMGDSRFRGKGAGCSSPQASDAALQVPRESTRHSRSSTPKHIAIRSKAIAGSSCVS